MAARSPGARLDPPMLLALDEIANLSPLPSLPTLMAEGGGSGITTMPVLQSLSQARDRWNEHQASAIWDAAIVKIVLGGASGARDLQDVSNLIGERDEYTDSVTLGDHGNCPTNAPSAASRSCHPTTSGACPSEPGSSSCAPRHPSSPTSTPGPDAPTPNSSPLTEPRSKTSCNAANAQTRRTHLPATAIRDAGCASSWEQPHGTYPDPAVRGRFRGL